MTKRKASFDDFRTGKYRRFSDSSHSWSSTMSDHALRFASRASGAALGFIGGDVPGAIEGAVYAGRAYDFTHQDDNDFRAVEGTLDVNPLPQTKTMGKAMYSGKFKKPKYSKPTAFDIAGKSGSIADVETYGNVVDPHCCYINHSTYQFDAISFSIRYALIRKLFKLAGIAYVNKYEELPLNKPDNSIGFKLIYTYYNTLNGVHTSTEYLTVDNQTLTDIVIGFIQFTLLLEEYMNGGAGNKEPYKLALYSADGQAITTEYRLASQLTISDEEIHLLSYSSMKVQNRTKGDLAGAADYNVERSDNQPLVVTLFEFRNADPRMRSASTFGIANHVLNGISLVNPRLLRAGSQATPGDFGPTNEFQNTPSKTFFQNCIKSSKSILQPGQMKESIVKYGFSGKGVAFFTKLKYENKVPVTNQISDVFGRSQLLVFEEKMRTAGSNQVTIAYERKYKVACYSVTRKNGYIQPNFSTYNWNADAIPQPV